MTLVTQSPKISFGTTLAIEGKPLGTTLWRRKPFFAEAAHALRRSYPRISDSRSSIRPSAPIQPGRRFFGFYDESLFVKVNFGFAFPFLQMGMDELSYRSFDEALRLILAV